MKITTFAMTTESMTESGNDMKEVFLETMQEQGLITKEQKDSMNKYCFVICKKGFFGKIWDSLWNEDKEAIKIIVVKMTQ